MGVLDLVVHGGEVLTSFDAPAAAVALALAAAAGAAQAFSP